MNDGHDTQSFHQGFNVAAVFGLCALGYYEVISAGMFVILMLVLIGIYSYRFR
jgi:hypothetical protein